MATEITRKYIGLNEGTVVEETSASGEFAIDLAGADYKTVLVFHSTAEVTVTIPVGDAIQGVGDDIEFTVPANGIAYLVVDSGAYKTVSGDNKGKLVGTASGDVSISAVELP